MLYSRLAVIYATLGAAFFIVLFVSSSFLVQPIVSAAPPLSCTTQDATITGNLKVADEISEQGKSLSSKYQEDITPNACPATQVAVGIEDSGNLQCSAITAAFFVPSACQSGQHLTSNGTSMSCKNSLENITWSDVTSIFSSDPTSAGGILTLTDFDDVVTVYSPLRGTATDEVKCPTDHPIRVGCSYWFSPNPYYSGWHSAPNLTPPNGCKAGSVGWGTAESSVVAYCIKGTSSASSGSGSGPGFVLSSISPTSGLTGSSVTLTGNGFGSAKGLSTVTFNGTVASTTAWGDTSITAIVPSSFAASTVLTVVVTVGGVASSPQTFTVTSLPPTPPPSSGMKGIYALDNSGGTYRDANITDLPFVDGYAWRYGWNNIETSSGVYDFKGVDSVVCKLAKIGQRLSIDSNRGGPSWITSLTPWDASAQSSFAAFVSALANHQIPACEGYAQMAVKDHPVVTDIHLGIPAMGALRDNPTSYAGYDRTKFENAVIQALTTAVTNFPNKNHYIGFWAIQDTNRSPELWQDLGNKIVSTFDGVKYPKIGFFMENAAAGKGPDTAACIAAAGSNPSCRVLGDTAPLTCFPSTTYAAPEYTFKDKTHIDFQMLQGWTQPFQCSCNTENTTPNEGLNCGYTNYGARYYEVYVDDLKNSAYSSIFTTWQATLNK